MSFLRLIFLLFLAISLMGSKCTKSESDASSKPVVRAHEQQVGSKDDALSCSNDADCVSIKVDCCDCNQGGKRRAIPKSQVEEANSKLLIDCEEVVCLQLISKDPSCSQKALCRSGTCVLQ